MYAQESRGVELSQICTHVNNRKPLELLTVINMALQTRSFSLIYDDETTVPCLLCICKP